MATPGSPGIATTRPVLRELASVFERYSPLGEKGCGEGQIGLIERIPLPRETIDPDQMLVGATLPDAAAVMTLFSLMVIRDGQEDPVDEACKGLTAWEASLFLSAVTAPTEVVWEDL